MGNVRAAQKGVVEPFQTADPTPKTVTVERTGKRQEMLWRTPLNTLWRDEEPSPNVCCYSTTGHGLAGKTAREKRWDSCGGS